MDKITRATATPLRIKKELFVEQNNLNETKVVPVSEADVKVGDLIKVRMELHADRAMEYIHIKDMRASGFEPTSTLSTYRYQNGLHFYQSTRDVATHFFIGHLPKGTFIFEYDLRVTQKGDFSNGITTAQCMYAPEFSSQSASERVKVD